MYCTCCTLSVAHALSRSWAAQKICQALSYVASELLVEVLPDQLCGVSFVACKFAFIISHDRLFRFPTSHETHCAKHFSPVVQLLYLFSF